MILRARAIWARKERIIRDGALQVCGDKIGQIGHRDDVLPGVGESLVDLGESIIFPAFVNAHCHLDFTGLAGELSPGESFADWVKQIVEIKRSLTLEDHESAWLNGAEMLVRTGCATVANIESVPELFVRMAAQTPLQVCPFTELIGFHENDEESALDLAKRELTNNKPFSLVAGLSPHAPYTTTPGLLSEVAGFADEHDVPVAIHVAESEDEWRMFTSGEGALSENMKALGRHPGDCGQSTPVEHVSRSRGLAKRTLVIHANYLGAEDSIFLAKPGTSVVHCPRSHAWFGYEPFEYERLAKAGANICLGTDSLASAGGAGSVVELNMFDEMRTFRRQHPKVPAADIIEMATMNGAIALGLQNVLGQLEGGSLANLGVIPLPNPLADVSEAILDHPGPVGSLLIAGKRVFSGRNSIAN